MKVILVDWSELCLLGETERILSVLPSSDRERISRYRMEPDRIRGAVSAVLQRSMATEAFPGQKLRIRRTEKGKPFLEGKDGFEFSVSHSGDLVAYVSAAAPVGIDVEKVKEIKPERFFRFFSEEERKALEESSNPRELFFQIWTAREALSKLLGEGLSLLEEESIPEPSIGRIVCRGKEYCYSSQRYREHWISLCGEEDSGSMELCPLSREEWETLLGKVKT